MSIYKIQLTFNQLLILKESLQLLKKLYKAIQLNEYGCSKEKFNEIESKKKELEILTNYLKEIPF